MIERTLTALPQYGRWQQTFEPALGVERVEFTAPDGSAEVRPTFLHQSAALEYDHHGYETVVPQGAPVTAVRFTPTQAGTYHYRALCGEETVQTGAFACAPSDHPGYVEVSRRDPRYFACSDGSPYCPIGLNICWPVRYPKPLGIGHFEKSSETITMGGGDYRRWFRLLAEHGGNYARIWLSNPYFETQTQVAGELDLAAFARLDNVVELARAHGIRLKLCFEHFRTFDTATNFTKALTHPEDGHTPRDIAEWFRENTWRALWLKKVRAYLVRYGGDPTIMAWELWNEINCCVTGDWAIQREWTRTMLREIKAMAPRQLVVNSLGSLDGDYAVTPYADFQMEEMDFQQAHRYLDQGAPLEICRRDPAALTVDVVNVARRPDKPVILAETGAVNDCHTGPFRFYRTDNRGIIHHDVTFPAFFAGAAAPGHIWHWDNYVDQKNLWGAYRLFADLLQGVELDAEAFRPVDLSTETARCLALAGTHHLLAWVRNPADNWEQVLRDEREPEPVPGLTLDLAPFGVTSGTVTLLWPWQENTGEATLTAGTLTLPPFRYGMLVKVKRG